MLQVETTDTKRIAQTLGIRSQANSRVVIANRVTSGLPVSSVKSFRRRVGTPIFEAGFAELETVSAEKSGAKLSQQTSEKLYEVARVYELTMRLYGGDKDAVDAFLSSPHALLLGETPLALTLKGHAGADAVIDLLYKSEAGFAA